MIQVYDGYVPSFDGEKFVHYSSVVIGDVRCGKYVNIWPNAVLRADVGYIKIGDYSNIQDGSVVHVDYDFPTVIGDYVTIGHNCNLHGCTIGNNSLIGIGSIVLDGAIIGENCIIAAGSVVPPRKVIPDNTLFLKGEFKPLSAEKGEENHKHAISYWDFAKSHIAKAIVL